MPKPVTLPISIQWNLDAELIKFAINHTRAPLNRLPIFCRNLVAVAGPQGVPSPLACAQCCTGLLVCCHERGDWHLKTGRPWTRCTTSCAASGTSTERHRLSCRYVVKEFQMLSRQAIRVHRVDQSLQVLDCFLVYTVCTGLVQVRASLP